MKIMKVKMKLSKLRLLFKKKRKRKKPHLPEIIDFPKKETLEGKRLKIKDIKLTVREKALLEIIIHEVKEVLPDSNKVMEVLDCWIKANNLHPEKVNTLKDLEEK